MEEDYSFKELLIVCMVLGLIVGGACQLIFGTGFFTGLLLMLAIALVAHFFGGEDERTTNRAEASDSRSEHGASVLDFQTSNSRAEEASSVPRTEDLRRKSEHEEEELTENQTQLRQQIRRLVTLTAWVREELQLMTADSVGFTEGRKEALKYQLHNAERTINQLKKAMSSFVLNDGSELRLADHYTDEALGDLAAKASKVGDGLHDALAERYRLRREEERQKRERRREEEKRQRIEAMLHRDRVWDQINYMSGSEFEQFMADLLRQKGYAVKETKATGDQGVDLLLDIDDKRVAVQLKRWTGPVGNAAVSATFAGMAHYQADEGWVITTSTFTKSARELARSTSVRLIDGKELGDWLEGLREEGEGRPTNKTPRTVNLDAESKQATVQQLESTVDRDALNSVERARIPYKSYPSIGVGRLRKVDGARISIVGVNSSASVPRKVLSFQCPSSQGIYRKVLRTHLEDFGTWREYQRHLPIQVTTEDDMEWWWFKGEFYQARFVKGCPSQVLLNQLLDFERKDIGDISTEYSLDTVEEVDVEGIAPKLSLDAYASDVKREGYSPSASSG